MLFVVIVALCLPSFVVCMCLGMRGHSIYGAGRIVLVVARFRFVDIIMNKFITMHCYWCCNKVEKLV